MTRFEPWSSGIRSNLSTNWATTTRAVALIIFQSLSFLTWLAKFSYQRRRRRCPIFFAESRCRQRCCRRRRRRRDSRLCGRCWRSQRLMRRKEESGSDHEIYFLVFCIFSCCCSCSHSCYCCCCSCWCCCWRFACLWSSTYKGECCCCCSSV